MRLERAWSRNLAAIGTALMAAAFVEPDTAPKLVMCLTGFAMVAFANWQLESPDA